MAAVIVGLFESDVFVAAAAAACLILWFVQRLAGSSSPLLPASGMGAAGLDRIITAVL
jgi:hypothetical protein